MKIELKTKKDLFDLTNSIEKVNLENIKKAQNELNRKMKPVGSLGILEEICKKMAGIYGYPLKKVEKKCHIVAAAVNGFIE